MTNKHRWMPILFLMLQPIAPAQTGRAVTGLEDFDRLMSQTLEKWKLPGGSLAIVRQGSLVFARGYGWADREHKIPAQPDTLYRAGSNSKTITAAAVMKLVENGQLSLDRTIVDLLGPELLPPQLIADQRWKRITVRHLLQHSGGWDESESELEPVLLTADILDAFGIPVPVPLTPQQVRTALIGIMASQPLQFDPGTRASYSSFGYLLLGRAIERVTGRPYEEAVRTLVFQPLGIRRAFQLGMTVTSRRLGEAEYYASAGEPRMPSVYHADRRLLAPPDGAALADPFDSTGGWVISAIDLLRFATGLERLLRADTLAQIKVRPSYEKTPQQYMGLGWLLISLGPGELDWFHDGAASGSVSVMFRGDTNGLGFVASFNSAPPNDALVNDLAVELLLSLRAAAAAVKQWPAGDQWARYAPANGPQLADAGVASAATGLPGAVSPGQIVSLYGTRLGPEAGRGAPPSDGRFPTELDGVRVLFDGQPAPLLHISEIQINAVAPYGLAGRSSVRIQVETRQGRSNELTLPVRDQAPGLFTLSGNGREQAAVLNEDLSINSASNPAAAGRTVSLFVTGTGAPRPAPPDGEIARTALDFAQPVKVTIGGREAELGYVGPAPGMVNGLVQVNVRVPAAAAPGETVVQIGMGDTLGRAGTTLFVK